MVKWNSSMPDDEATPIMHPVRMDCVIDDRRCVAIISCVEAVEEATNTALHAISLRGDD